MSMLNSIFSRTQRVQVLLTFWADPPWVMLTTSVTMSRWLIHQEDHKCLYLMMMYKYLLFTGPDVLQRVLLGRSSKRKGKEKEKIDLFRQYLFILTLQKKRIWSLPLKHEIKIKYLLEYFTLSRHFLFHCESSLENKISPFPMLLMKAWREGRGPRLSCWGRGWSGGWWQSWWRRRRTVRRRSWGGSSGGWRVRTSQTWGTFMIRRFSSWESGEI